MSVNKFCSSTMIQLHGDHLHFHFESSLTTHDVCTTDLRDHLYNLLYVLVLLL